MKQEGEPSLDAAKPCVIERYYLPSLTCVQHAFHPPSVFFFLISTQIH